MTDCTTCGGSGFIVLPTKRPTAVARYVTLDDSEMEMDNGEYKQYPCPVCTEPETVVVTETFWQFILRKLGIRNV